VAFVALIAGLLGFARSIVSSMATSGTSHEAGLAREAARQQIEVLRDMDLEDIFASFNTDPGDDPDGAGTAPGRFFAVEELDLALGDADGFAGEVLLPYVDVAPGVLREDLVDKRLGLPRDLNGDGAVDELDHAGDYQLLPVLVRVEWRSTAGTGRVELRTMLGNLR